MDVISSSSCLQHRRQESRDEDGENREEGYNDLSPHNHYPSRPPWNENWNRTEVLINSVVYQQFLTKCDEKSPQLQCVYS